MAVYNHLRFVFPWWQNVYKGVEIIDICWNLKYQSVLPFTFRRRRAQPFALGGTTAEKWAPYHTTPPLPPVKISKR